MATPNHGLHARVWVAGELIFDDDLPYGPDAEAIGERHAAAVEQAVARGELYAVEVTDPDGLIPPRRWGSDIGTLARAAAEGEPGPWHPN
jgi:hypothetical protein